MIINNASDITTEYTISNGVQEIGKDPISGIINAGEWKDVQVPEGYSNVIVSMGGGNTGATSLNSCISLVGPGTLKETNPVG